MMLPSRRIVPTLLLAGGFLAAPLLAQDYRVAGGVTLPRAGGTGAAIGGQVQASVELGPRSAGVGVRFDVLFSQSSAPALSHGPKDCGPSCLSRAGRRSTKRQHYDGR